MSMYPTLLVTVAVPSLPTTFLSFSYARLPFFFFPTQMAGIRKVLCGK